MLNEKAKAIYEFIKDSINSGFPPTVREICNALDIKSTSTVHKYINLLVSEGYLEKMDNHNRAIKLKGGNNVSVPLVGDVAACLLYTSQCQNTYFKNHTELLYDSRRSGTT